MKLKLIKIMFSSINHSRSITAQMTILLLVFALSACNESNDELVTQRIAFKNSVTQISGGAFRDIKRREAVVPNLNLHLHLSSINTQIETVIDSCQAINLNFYMAKNSANFHLDIRIYQELNTNTDPLQQTSNDYVRFEGGIFQALSSSQSLSLSDYAQVLRNSSDAENDLADDLASGHDMIEETPTTAWQFRFNQDGKAFQVLPLERAVSNATAIEIDSAMVANDAERNVISSCIKQSEQKNSGRLLVRQSLSYGSREDFYFALTYGSQNSLKFNDLLNRLTQKVQSELETQLDGLFIFHNPSELSQVSTSRSLLKKVLDQLPIFTWALPSELDRELDELQGWRLLFANENFASDFQTIRLLFMDSTLLHLNQSQLDQLDRWLSDQALSNITATDIHTRALVSLRSFSNPNSGTELSYQQDALRTLNRLRKAHMTHQFIGVESFNEPIGDTGQSHLGTKILAIPKKHKALILKIPHSCPLDILGEACFNPRYLEF